MAFTPDYEAITGRPEKRVTFPVAEGQTYAAVSALGGGSFVGTWVEGWLMVTDAPDGTERRILVTATDRARFNDLSPRSRTWVTVTNLIDNKPIQITRGPCGLGCYCGAKSRPVTTD